jgi:hypothetical protein
MIWFLNVLFHFCLKEKTFAIVSKLGWGRGLTSAFFCYEAEVCFPPQVLHSGWKFCTRDPCYDFKNILAQKLRF